MFGISAEVGVLPVFEAAEEVVRFIEGLRLLAYGCDEQDRHDGEEDRSDERRGSLKRVGGEPAVLASCLPLARWDIAPGGLVMFLGR